MMSAMNTQTITPNTARKREAAAAAAADKPVRDHTLALTLSYNGAPFSGFARQPGQTTVQGDLEDALRMLFRRDVETTCAGRTDAGVHALGQVVSFDVDDRDIAGRSLPSLRRSLNALTHDAITVREVEPKKLGFSARFDAQAREYHYHLCVDSTCPIFMKDFSWFVPGGLDITAMEAGAQYLLGEHDFKSFCMAASAEGKPTHRNVREISFPRDGARREHPGHQGGGQRVSALHGAHHRGHAGDGGEGSARRRLGGRGAGGVRSSGCGGERPSSRACILASHLLTCYNRPPINRRRRIMFSTSTAKRVAREAEKIVSLKEDMDAVSWTRVLEIGNQLQEGVDEAERVSLARELVSIAQSNRSLYTRLGLDPEPSSSRVMASGIEVMEGGLAEAAIEKRGDRGGRRPPIIEAPSIEPEVFVEEPSETDFQAAGVQAECDLVAKNDPDESDFIEAAEAVVRVDSPSAPLSVDPEPVDPAPVAEPAAQVEATKPEEPSSTQPQQEPRPEPEPKPESVAAPKEKPPRQRRFARFRNLYESRDGGLCVFEDEHGHLVAVDSSKLA